MAASLLEVITKQNRRHIGGMKLCHQAKSLVAIFLPRLSEQIRTQFVYFFFGDK